MVEVETQILTRIIESVQTMLEDKVNIDVLRVNEIDCTFL
jgi:hypothetical protein